MHMQPLPCLLRSPLEQSYDVNIYERPPTKWAIFGQTGYNRMVRKLQNKERHNLYPSPNFTTAIKARKMSWMTHGGRKIHSKLSRKNLKGRDNLKDEDLERNIIQTRVGATLWTVFTLLGILSSSGFLWWVWWTFKFHKKRGILYW
jgi:hypothetical protein